MNLLSWVLGNDAEIVCKLRFQVLLLANGVSALGLSVLSPVLESLTGPLGVSTANVGLLISFFTAPAIVVIPLAGLLADRVGRKPVLVSGLVLFGLAGTAIAVTHDFRIQLGLRLLQGIGFAGITPTIITSIGDLYDGSEEATAQGLRFSGSGVVQTVFPVLSAAMVVFAWQYPFMLYVLALPVAGMVYVLFDEPTDGGHSSGNGQPERDWLSNLSALYRLVSQQRVLAIVFARGLPMIFWLGFLTYNSIIVVRLIGGTPLHAGLLAATGCLTYASAATQAGRVTAIFDSRFYPLVGANLAVGFGYLVVVMARTLAIATIGIIVAGFGFGIALSLYRSIITGLAPESLRGSLVSVSEAFGQLVGTATPIIMGAAIAVASPAIGFEPAIRTTGVGAAIIVAGGGSICLHVASVSPPVE